MGISYIMTNDEMREIQAQQDELTRKLNEKISHLGQIPKNNGRNI